MPEMCLFGMKSNRGKFKDVFVACGCYTGDGSRLDAYLETKRNNLRRYGKNLLR
jgi:hypothetical protein